MVNMSNAYTVGRLPITEYQLADWYALLFVKLQIVLLLNFILLLNQPGLSVLYLYQPGLSVFLCSLSIINEAELS